jgi:hypothetical protein
MTWGFSTVSSSMISFVPPEDGRLRHLVHRGLDVECAAGVFKIQHRLF